MPWVVALLLFAGCDTGGGDGAGQGPPPGAAAGEGEGEADSGAQPEAPSGRTPVEGPRLTDWECARGQHAEVVGEGKSWEHRICVPAPTTVEPCPAGQAQLHDDDGCRDIGLPCPAPGEGPPSDEAIRSMAPGFEGPIIHVRDTDGGFAEALRRRPEPGSILVLGPGQWTLTELLFVRLAVVGWCVRDTRLQTVDPTQPIATLAFGGGGGGLVANLSFSGPVGNHIGVHAAAPDGRVQVLDVHVEAPREAGVFFGEGSPGGRVERVRVEGGAGQGVGVAECQDVRIDGLQVRSVAGAGVLAYAEEGAATVGVHVENLRVDDVGLHGAQFGWCHGSTLRRAHIGGAASVGVLANARAAPPAEHEWTLQVEDVRVTDPVGGPMTRARGLEANGATRVQARRISTVGPREFGFMAISDLQPGVTLDLDQVVVQDTTGHGQGQIFYGIGLLGGVDGAVRRAAVVRASGGGVGIAAWEGDAHPEAVVEDLVVFDTRSPDPWQGATGCWPSTAPRPSCAGSCSTTTAMSGCSRRGGAAPRRPGSRSPTSRCAAPSPRPAIDWSSLRCAANGPRTPKTQVDPRCSPTTTCGSSSSGSRWRPAPRPASSWPTRPWSEAGRGSSPSTPSAST